MKKLSLSTTLAFSLALGLVQGGCGDDDKNDDTNNNRPDSGTPYRDAGAGLDSGVGLDSGLRDDAGSSSNPDSGVSALTDSQIAGIIATVNTGEIDQGTAASSKATNAAIKDYASTMVTHHTQSTAMLTTLLTSAGLSQATSPVSQQLTSDAMKVLTRLESIPQGENFDHEYIAAQVLQHQIVLDLINNQLRPQVDNADLKTFVEQTRAVVQSHLAAANTLANAYSVGPDGGAVGGPDAGTSGL